MCAEGVQKRWGRDANLGSSLSVTCSDTDGVTQAVLFSIQLLLSVTCGTNVSFGP